MNALDPQELDAVRELVNIASGNAATALAAMIGQRTMISVPRVTLERVERVASIIDTLHEPTVVISMQVLGDVTGYLLFLIPLTRAHALSSMLLGIPASAAGAFDASSRSALQETANVLAGAYTGALGSVIQGIVMITIPVFAIEPPDDVLARYRDAAVEASSALCIETSISIDAAQEPCGAHIVLLPLGGTLEAILTALRATI